MTVSAPDEASLRRAVAAALDESPKLPCRVVFKPVVKTPDEILGLLDLLAVGELPEEIGSAAPVDQQGRPQIATTISDNLPQFIEVIVPIEVVGLSV